MPIKPRHTPGVGRPVAQRQFTDREDFIKTFQTALAAKQPDKHQVLVFYGVGGIGKTSLRRELTRLLASEPGVITAALDFDVPGYRDQDTALFALRKALREKHKVQFPSFDIAYAVLWRKTRPQTPMTRDNFCLLESGTVLADAVDVLGDVTIVGTIPKLAAVALKGSQAVRDWWTKRGSTELRELPSLEPPQIAERLPMFWASDLKDFLAANGKRAVLFLDTYEALTETERSEGKLFQRDEWLRELVAQLPGVLWVVCGREMLRWAELDPDWKENLDQHLVGGLADDDARRFLRTCGIEDQTIVDTIVQGSQGLPYYLDLAVDTYLEAKRRGVRPSTADFAHTPAEVFTRFLRHLTQPEIETLKVLAIPRFWDHDLLESLVTRFNTGYPLTAFSDLCRFSFIRESTVPETWAMHQLMRQSLQEHQAPELKEQVGKFLYDYYARQSLDISPGHVTDALLYAIAEASYHGARVAEPASYLEWTNRVVPSIDLSGRSWQLQLSLARERYQALAERLGSDHPAVVRTLGYVGKCLQSLGDYRSAEPILREALARGEKALDSASTPFVRILYNVADLCLEQARFSEAEPLYERAAETLRSTAAPDRILLAQVLGRWAGVCSIRGRYADADKLFREAIATLSRTSAEESTWGVGWLPLARALALQNYGNFCREQGRVQEAEPLFREALAIAERAAGHDHLHVGYALNNLGWLLAETGRFSEAEPLLLRALAIYEDALGAYHPELAVGPIDSVAELYRHQDRIDESKKLHQRALEISEGALGSEHPNVAHALYGLAEIRLAQKKPAEAEALFQRALKIRERALAPGHPETTRVLNGLARLYDQIGRAAEAEQIRARLEAIRRKN
jgi:tetratricopeptide (TPR) repeat protein